MRSHCPFSGATGERDPIAAELYRNGWAKRIVITGQGGLHAKSPFIGEARRAY
jgi:hypothetical protein